MKKIFVVVSFICFVQAKAQIARETRLNALDSDRFALSIEILYEPKIVEEAWNQKSSDLKIKGKTNKGLLVYEGVKVLDIHYEAIDLYVKMEKLDKAKTNFTISISKGAGNFVDDTNDKKTIDNAKNFLVHFAAYCDQYKLKLDIKELEEQIKKAQKEQEKLVDEGKKLEQQLQKSKADQEAKTKEIQNLQSSLEQLRSKLK